jgi:hypothetical protein
MCSYSWRVPFSVGSSELQIIPSQELGKAGLREGPPAVFPWRWYYHLASLAFWGLVVVPLVLVKENRRWQAWAILIPLGLVLGICQMLVNSMPGPLAAEGLRAFLVTLATAWAFVWLLGFRFAGRHRWLAVAATFLIVLAVGLLSYLCNFGAAMTESLPTLSIYYAVFALALTLPMWMSTRCCRRVYAPGRFMLWLLVWTPLTLAAALLLLIVGTAVLASFSAGLHAFAHILIVVPMVAVLGGVYGFMLYLLNLPFLLLAFRNSFYRERFCKVFGLQPAPDSAAETVAISEKPPDADQVRPAL